MVDDVVVGIEDAVGQPVVAHELPDVLDRIELGRAWRQGENSDVGGHIELGRGMPTGLIHHQDGMGSRGDGAMRHSVLLQNGRTKAAPLPSCGR